MLTQQSLELSFDTEPKHAKTFSLLVALPYCLLSRLSQPSELTQTETEPDYASFKICQGDILIFSLLFALFS
jgi:hypothetical protein